MNSNSSVTLLIAIAALVQIALLVWAFVLWLKTDESRLTLQPRWIWLVIILLINTIGPIAFLIAGRKPTESVAEPSQNGAGIEDLYDR